MKVKDIIEAHRICFLSSKKETCEYCTKCPMYPIREGNCQMNLAQATIDKLKELTQLLDDKVNHHYYDTLEQYQEMNAQLQDKLDKIESILAKS